MKRIETARAIHGICSMIVCCEKDATDEEILNHCNADNPAGPRGGWQDVVRDDKEYPSRNPVPCEIDANRLHIIVDC